MRVTQNITYNTYLNDIMRKQDSIYNLHRQLATQKKLNAPSDDPVKVNTVLTSRTTLASIEQYGQNIDSGLSYLSVAEDTLGDIKDTLTSIKEHAVTANGLRDASSRQNIALVVRNLNDQLKSLANANYDDKYIFAGYETTTVPFDALGNYLGDANKFQLKIGAASTVTIGVNGGEIFKGTAGGVDIFQSVNDLVTALEANDTAGIQSSLTNLEASFNQVTNAVSDIGGKVNRLNAMKTDYEHNKLELRSMISNIEDADITKIISELQLGQVALEASMKSAAKIFDANIFDYL